MIEVIIKLDKPELRSSVSQAKSKLFSSESTVASSSFFSKVERKTHEWKGGGFFMPSPECHGDREDGAGKGGGVSSSRKREKCVDKESIIYQK